MTTSPNTPKRTSLAVAATAAIVAAAGIGGWLHTQGASAADKPQAKDAPPVAVSLTSVQERDVPLYLAGVGTVTANASVTVKVRIDGQLDKVGFKEGEEVKKGQLLAQIDPRALQAQLAQVEAQRARDAAQLANARLDLQRYTTLRSQDAATQQQLDTQKALVTQLEAAVKTDEAQIGYAKVQLSYTTITAPISGRVGARLVDPGNIVHAADANGLVVINQIDPITLLFTLPEESVPAINKSQLAGQSLKVTAYARESQEPLATGKLILLDNQINTTSGTVQLKARFDNAGHKLWPGQYVNVRLQMHDHGNALTLPASAIQRNQQGTYVYAVDEQERASMKPVKVERIQDGIAVLAGDAGVAAGQRVVLDGQYKLKPGARIVESKPQQKAAAGADAKGSSK
ncbi:efflux RND transporter periplasmic adaptor subunit [Herbaspirillum sp. WKF16]|jgi:multidrug efflux system membrane fusion protein|uniref:efflux RND transporter periplasmic adaptor subunit n=1 Tax=Herbaspirillum sp. WKF16 TaxID=3028312 RepID=UPI0023AA05D3|nr:efflux RND transporter periplasmic adaptor subunit [Herbaspirillum sp. WKF16]WDZ94223.1 efflux RND transporter periplasmic adaptor subunit [Herbaspirillum sp. WKF16]